MSERKSLKDSKQKPVVTSQVVPVELERLWFVPDTHRPYHDKRAWRLMMKAAKGFKPDVITIIGDFGDFYAVSDHVRDPKRKAMFDLELADANVGLDELDSLNAKRKIYIKGNHEYRLAKYLRTRAPALDGIVSIEEKYHLQLRGWEIIEYMDHTTIGKLHLTHDVGAAGQNAVYRAATLFEHSVVTGHTHRLAYITEGNALGTSKVSASFGWLGDIKQMDYMSRAKAMKDWTLAFGYGYHDKRTGFVYLVPAPIVDYTAKVENTIYSEPKGRR